MVRHFFPSIKFFLAAFILYWWHSSLLCTSKLLPVCFELLPRRFILWSLRSRLSCMTFCCFFFFWHPNTSWTVDSSISLMFVARASTVYVFNFVLDGFSHVRVLQLFKLKKILGCSSNTSSSASTSDLLREYNYGACLFKSLDSPCFGIVDGGLYLKSLNSRR